MLFENRPRKIETLPLPIPKDARIYRPLTHSYVPYAHVVMQRRNASFLASGRKAGPRGRFDMVASRSGPSAPALKANLRGTRSRGRGTRVTDPSS